VKSRPIPWVLFADMDGTVVDEETYGPGPALRALERCRSAGVPVVLNSSKTRAEMELFHQVLPLLPGAPFVSENGGGVFLPRRFWDAPEGARPERAFWKVTLGRDHAALLPVLRSALNRLGLAVDLFSDLTPEEIASRTGLPPEQAGLAREREFDEPLGVREDSAAGLQALGDALRREGLRLTRGGRCHHVHGASDKGTAARFVMEQYRKWQGGPVPSAGVGNAANDLPLLEAVDRAYLLRGSDGTHDPETPEGRGIRRLAGVGPPGFCQAVEDLLCPGARPGPGVAAGKGRT